MYEPPIGVLWRFGQLETGLLDRDEIMLPNPLHPSIVHFPVVLAFLLPLFAAGALWAIRLGATAPYQLGAGRLESSPWARAFLDAFVFGDAVLRK